MSTNLTIIDLIHYLLKKTLFEDYLSKIKEVIRMHNNKEIEAEKYCELHEVMKNKVAYLTEQYISKYPGYFPKREDFDVAEKLLWYLLHFPVGVASESQVVLSMCEFPLTNLIPAFRDVFARLFLEAQADNKEYGNKKREYFDLIQDTVKWLDDELKPETPKSESGVYQFWCEMPEKNEYFHRFALGTSAYFNKKMTDSLKEDITKQQKYLKRLQDTELTAEQRLSAYKEIKKIKDKFEKFPPCKGVHIVPQTIIRYGLSMELEPAQEIEDLDKEQFWDNIEAMMIAKKDVETTFHRKNKDYDIFLSATADHKTIWGKYGREQEKLAIMETMDEDATADQREHVLFEFGVKVNIDEDVDRQRYLRQVIAKRQIERYAQGGLIRTRYCSDNLNMLTFDRICMFIGFLGQSTCKLKLNLINAFLESIMTGAAICRILPPEVKKRKKKDNSINDPVNNVLPGLIVFPQAESLFNEAPEKHYEPFIEQYKAYNGLYKEFAFKLHQTAYTGRARLIDVEGFSPLETAYCCGAVLPGIRSSLYYIEPSKNLDNKLNKANIHFINELIIFADKGLRGPLSSHNGMIKASEKYLKEYLETLKGENHRVKTRNNKWQEPKPHRIALLSESDRDDIMNRLCKKAKEAESLENQVEHVCASVMYCVDEVSLSRPCESKLLKRNSISIEDDLLFIIAKSNAKYREARATPVPPILKELFIDYQQYLERPEIQLLIAKNRYDKLFPNVEGAYKDLRATIHEVDLTYEPYDIRRTGATSLHTEHQASFELIEAQMGHSQTGFEFIGPFSRMSFDSLRDMLTEYSKEPGISNRIKSCKKLLGKLNGK